MLLAGLLATAANACICADTAESYDLIAAQRYDAGSVTVTSSSNDGINCYIKEVEYNTENTGWCLTKTHLHVGDPFPLNKAKNPKIGLFEPGGVSHECATSYTYDNIDSSIQVPCNTVMNIAAHAVVAAADFSSLPHPTPGGSVKITSFGVPGNDLDPSFWDVDIDFLDSMPPIRYDAWCIDRTTFLSNGEMACANLYHDYGELPDAVKDLVVEENLDKVNYIINNFSAGDDSDCSDPDGVFTYEDIQGAIWELVEPGFPPRGNECRRNEIVAAANMNGDGFVPTCEQYTAVIIVPFICGDPTSLRQLLVAEMLLGCDIDETAWGDGIDGMDFGGKSWGKYIEHDCDCDCDRRERHLRAA